MDPWVAEFAKDAANVVLGWGLGLAGASLVERRKEWRDARNVKRAISRELREVAHRMLGLIYKLEGRRGALNRQLLEWMHPQIQRYAGPNPKDGMLTGVGGLLGSSDREIAALAAHEQATTPPQFWPVEEPSYTVSAVGKLHDLDSDYAVRVLDVISHIRMLNDARENALYNLRLTFAPGLTPVNYDKASENHAGAEAQAAKRARIIVDKISAFEERYPQDA